jgi:hypothetical protein
MCGEAMGAAMKVVEPGGTEVLFPPPPGSLRVALLCIAFRAGAEVSSHLLAWTCPDPPLLDLLSISPLYWSHTLAVMIKILWS